MIAKYVNSKIV